MPLECGIIFDGIPEGAISRKVGLIWGIPVYMEDVAAQAVETGSQSGSSVAAAAGPDTFSFEDLLRLLAS